jgi:hypothetical protein
MRRMTTGRDAAPEGSASSAEPPGASGDTARPNYMGPSGNGLVEADERGGNPAESRAFRMGAPVRFQKAVSGSKEKRRGEAPKGVLVRVMDRRFPPAGGTGPTSRRPPGAAFRTSASRRFAPLGLGANPQRRLGARSPGAIEHGVMHARRKMHREGSRCRSLRTCLSTVMPGLVPGIHALLHDKGRRGWPGHRRA